MDASCRWTFLLTINHFFLQLCLGAFLLVIGACLLTGGTFLLLTSGVVPANQTEESEVRKLSGKESRTGSGTPFACKYYTKPPQEGGSGTTSGLLPEKFSNLTFFLWFAMPEYRVRQYTLNLYGSTPPLVSPTFLASKLRRKGNPAIRLPFVLQYASHMYGSTPPICTAVLLEKYWGLGSPERCLLQFTIETSFLTVGTVAKFSQIYHIT